MNEYEIWASFGNALKRLNTENFLFQHGGDGIYIGGKPEKFRTSSEIHNYLNGYMDGKSTQNQR